MHYETVGTLTRLREEYEASVASVTRLDKEGLRLMSILKHPDFDRFVRSMKVTKEAHQEALLSIEFTADVPYLDQQQTRDWFNLYLDSADLSRIVDELDRIDTIDKCMEFDEGLYVPSVAGFCLDIFLKDIRACQLKSGKIL